MAYLEDNSVGTWEAWLLWNFDGDFLTVPNRSTWLETLLIYFIYSFHFINYFYWLLKQELKRPTILEDLSIFLFITDGPVKFDYL